MGQITKMHAFRMMIRRLRDGQGFGVGHDGYCTYDQDVNGGCAIGCLLPDNKLAHNVDGVDPMFHYHPEVAELFEESESMFWRSLQRWHDRLARCRSTEEAMLACVEQLD